MYYLYSTFSAGGFVWCAAKEISSRQWTNSWEKQTKLETRNCVSIRMIRIDLNSPFLQLFWCTNIYSRRMAGILVEVVIFAMGSVR